MTAQTMQHPLTGAPYAQGDPIAVECEGVWREGVIEHVAPILGLVSFGVRWMLTVRLTEHERVLARCDDNGRNFRYREQVCPSTRVSA